MIEKKMAVVILNYNDYRTTAKLLDTIINYNNIENIVVVDNCSTNNSYQELLCYQSQKCHIIQSKKNGGYAYGNNYGITYALNNFSCDIIAILNPDVYFEEDVIHSIKDGFQNGEYALLAPVMYNIDGSISNRPYWDLPTYSKDLGMCFSLYRKIDSKKIRHVNYEKPIMEVDVLPGSFLAFDKTALCDVGLFDDSLFLYCEERMMAYKLKEKGYKTGLLTNCKYDHMHSVVTRKYIKEVEINKLMSKARLFYEKKYNKIGLLRETILRIAMFYSHVETVIIGKVKCLLRSYSK